MDGLICLDYYKKMRCFLKATSFLLLFSICLAQKSASLYSKTDQLWILNSSNFNNVVLGKENAWIIEFYNNWCGHCIRFVPTWKQFAVDTSTWRKVIDVGAVNCNDPENVQLCRQYDVNSYPTIKLFWHHTNQTDLGEVLVGDRDIASIEYKILQFLDSHWIKGIPTAWPDLQPVIMKRIDHLIQSMPESSASTFLFIEHPNSYVGRQVILDFSYQSNIIIRRVLTTNDGLLNDLNYQLANDTVPGLVQIYRNRLQIPIFKFSNEDNSTAIRDQIFETLIGVPRNQTKVGEKEKEVSTPPSIVNSVYMTDLENAVYSLLSQEVGVTKTIQGEKLSALKAFLSVLKTYFPGAPNVMGYLSNLYNWVSYKKHSIAGEDFVQAMDQIQTKTEYLPKMKEWVGCKGSEARFRGYPCSLWTLFHTLTVSADAAPEAEENAAIETSGEVLFIIRDYVEHFFTCHECSAHFLQMAENIENDVKTSEQAVLWLWEGHNKVNKRLAGDITEDPRHPKIQFPSAAECPKCRVESEIAGNVVWDTSNVLEYLHSFYNKENILGQDKDNTRVTKDPNVDSAAMGSKLLSNRLQIFLCYCFITSVNFWMYFVTSRHGA